ncbi:MAG: DedA family protein [Gordonia sp. (in: high G+C Gram-positive bacteria)]
MTGFADQLIELIESVPSWEVYAVSGGVVFVETATLVAGLILPSEALLLAAGVAAAVGPTLVGWLIVATAAAAVAGDSVGFWVGHRYGHQLRSSWLGRRFGEDRWAKAAATIDGNGMVVVGTGRWVGYVRSIVPRVAGMSEMRFTRFWIADAVGAVSWVSAVLMAGYFAGAVLGAQIMLYVAVALVVAVIIYYLVRWLRRRRDGGPIAARSTEVGPVGALAAVPGGECRAHDELDLVEDHQWQHDQPDH